jgi:hypothetical protein
MILRRKHKMNFTTISNVPIRQETLSAEALAFLVYLYSQPDDWRVSHQNLMQRFRVGRNKAYAILGELLQTGYITRQPMKTKSGHFLGYEYIVDDEPQVDAA